jgi:hypothetical protein
MAPPPFAPPAQYGMPYGYATPSRNGLAIASMVCGIVGVVMFFLYAIPCIVAVVLGHVALSQIKRTGQAGKGMAVAGIATGYTGIGLFALALVLALSGS